MMTTRIVYRLLDSANELLGWTEDEADVRGDGALRASHTIVIELERAGLPAMVSVHFVDINVETSVACPPGFHVESLQAGTAVSLYAPGEIVLRLGEPAGGLPPVTVRRSVTISPPVGTLVGVGNR